MSITRIFYFNIVFNIVFGEKQAVRTGTGLRPDPSCAAPAASALQPYIPACQFADLIGTGDAGKDPVGIAGLHLLERQIGGYNGGMPVELALADAGEELRGDKGVGEFRPQVVDDQEIAVVEVACKIAQGISRSAAEGAVGESVK